MKVEKDALNDGGKSAMMTMRGRPLAGCSRLELRQLEQNYMDSGHSAIPTKFSSSIMTYVHLMHFN